VVLDVATMTERLKFRLHDFSVPHSLAISPDNQILAIGTGSDASLWDLQTGKLRCVLAMAGEGEGEADT